MPTSVEIPADVVEAPTPQPSTTESDGRRARAARVTERHDRDAERAAAAAEKARAKEERQLRRAEEKSASDDGSEQRKAEKAEFAAAAAEQARAKKEARRQKADSKKRARAARAEAKREAKAAGIEARDQARAERVEEKRRAKEAKQQAEQSEAEEAKQQDQHESEAAGTHAAAGAAVLGATSVVEPEAPDEPETQEEPTAEAASEEVTPEAADTEQPSRPDRAGELESTQPIGRVQVHRDPEPKPEKRRSSIRGVGSIVAAAVGILGLVFSVILAVGALTVAMGAGEGNAIYDPISTVCDALAGPLKDAFEFSGPNAASREEFLGWGAGSLIYLAISFAGQAAHRSLTRD